MILKIFVLKSFKCLIRRRFILRRKFSFFQIKTLKMKNLIKSLKRIIEINFSFSKFNR